MATTLAQWLLAATFLFSGFVKALDPMGMEHKLEAYCNHMGWNIPAGSLYLDAAAVTLALVEFTLGVYLLLGMRKRLTAIGTFLFMLVMTAMTVYIYLYSPVPDCGCFGDAITLTTARRSPKTLCCWLAHSCFSLPDNIRCASFLATHNGCFRSLPSST